jgi:molybdate/tungstate transport system substrate-binding protein
VQPRAADRALSTECGERSRGCGDLPFLSLPAETNLGAASTEKEYQQASVTLNGKPHQPSPLVFYAAVLKDAPQTKLAVRFVVWLQSPEARQILSRYHYGDPGDAKPLVS